MRAPLPIVLSLFLVPTVLLGAQPPRPDSGFQFRLFGDVKVPRDAHEGAVVVLQGNATIEGKARAVAVLNGDAIISGGSVEDLTVVHGTAQLGPGAVVTHDVHLIDAEITLAEGARVTGTIERGAGPRMARDLMGLAALVGLGVLLALILGGVLAAEAAPHGVRAAGDLMRTDLPRVALGALLAWIVMPMLAIMLVPTLIGLPMGIGYFVFVLPILWFSGLLVAGTWAGDQLLGRLRGRVEATRPWLAALTGITALLLLGRLPFVGAVVFVLVAMGGGAVALTTWRNVRSPRPTATEASMRIRSALPGIALVFAASALAPGNAAAQTLADTRSGERVRLVIHDSLRQGVFQRRRQDVIGQFVRATTDSVWIRPLGASDLGVARNAIARASVSSGASRWKSALLLGAGWGLGMAAAVAFSDEDLDDGHRGRDIWIGAGAGVGAGLVIGASMPFELWRGVKP